MKFRDLFSVKHILFGLGVVALFVVFGIIASVLQVKVNFSSEAVEVRSKQHTLLIPYEMVASVDLQPLPEAGEEVANSKDDDTIRTGSWKNSVWGEYDIVADLDADNCIVVGLTDGRTFVFSIKDSAQTEKTFETFQAYLKAYEP